VGGKRGRGRRVGELDGRLSMGILGLVRRGWLVGRRGLRRGVVVD